ncbi:hypothetical protein PENSOL_c122G02298 [Penicillium solitum]|uniref:Uncharacterized protein n=1 Tax=Penicillium solitum TaxID=60172 RepID=A0A1V6Q6D1_9EURO|nr:uncharacterized protein PENSOL_c122G02298 [Penicillium solitum]OQD84472.1 hypothetical protein PENSOL_c122G02298 [Penicillium solitum]
MDLDQAVLRMPHKSNARMPAHANDPAARSKCRSSECEKFALKFLDLLLQLFNFLIETFNFFVKCLTQLLKTGILVHH